MKHQIMLYIRNRKRKNFNYVQTEISFVINQFAFNFSKINHYSMKIKSSKLRNVQIYACVKLESIEHENALTMHWCNLKIFDKCYDERSIQFKFQLRSISHLMKNLNIYLEMHEWTRETTRNKLVFIDKIDNFLYIIERWFKYKRYKRFLSKKSKKCCARNIHLHWWTWAIWHWCWKVKTNTMKSIKLIDERWLTKYVIKLSIKSYD